MRGIEESYPFFVVDEIIRQNMNAEEGSEVRNFYEHQMFRFPGLKIAILFSCALSIFIAWYGVAFVVNSGIYDQKSTGLRIPIYFPPVSIPTGPETIGYNFTGFWGYYKFAYHKYGTSEPNNHNCSVVMFHQTPATPGNYFKFSLENVTVGSEYTLYASHLDSTSCIFEATRDMYLGVGIACIFLIPMSLAWGVHLVRRLAHKQHQYHLANNRIIPVATAEDEEVGAAFLTGSGGVGSGGGDGGGGVPEQSTSLLMDRTEMQQEPGVELFTMESARGAQGGAMLHTGGTGGGNNEKYRDSTAGDSDERAVLEKVAAASSGDGAD